MRQDSADGRVLLEPVERLNRRIHGVEARGSTSVIDSQRLNHTLVWAGQRLIHLVMVAAALVGLLAGYSSQKFPDLFETACQGSPAVLGRVLLVAVGSGNRNPVRAVHPRHEVGMERLVLSRRLGSALEPEVQVEIEELGAEPRAGSQSFLEIVERGVGRTGSGRNERAAAGVRPCDLFADDDAGDSGLSVVQRLVEAHADIDRGFQIAHDLHGHS